MKVQLMLFCFLTTLFFITGCVPEENQSHSSLNIFDETNTELRIKLIREHLINLQNSKDSIFYKKREHSFDLLIENNDSTVKYIEKYISDLEEDFNNKGHSPAFFQKQIDFLKEECKTDDYLKIISNIIQFEELLYSNLKKTDAFMFDGIDRLRSCVTPFKSTIRLGDTLRTSSGVFACNILGNRWYNKTDIYYVQKDTILLKSFEKALGDSKSEYQKIEFAPQKKGNYLIKGSNYVYVDNEYKDLQFEHEFSVK